MVTFCNFVRAEIAESIDERIALAKDLLSKKLAAELALALAGINHCQYCASSHTVLSKFAGLNDAQIVNALKGKVDDAKDAAAINFAKTVDE